MNKTFISGGCSFSAKNNTWPIHTYNVLKQHGYNNHIITALPSQGNGLISRRIVYEVDRFLLKNKPENLLVGVMWSGPDRADYRCISPDLLQFKQDNTFNGWEENPTGFVNGAEKNWVIMNHHWGNDKKNKNKECELYYNFFYDKIGSVIYTLEHMLRVQWFLKANNILYFFTVYQDFVLNQFANHPETSYLYRMLDKSNFLPVSSEYSWLVKHTQFPHHWQHPHPGNHPSQEQHKEFGEQVVIPWLKDRQIIS